MRILTAEDVHRALDYPSLVDALAAMFRQGCEAPVRHHHRIGDKGTLLLMPAWQPDGPIGVKLVTVFPGNRARSLPSVAGAFLLLDGDTGLPAALIDGPALTLRRTAAASALAARFLARPDSAVHLMVGTGALAPHLVAAHRAVRPIRETRIWGRDPAKAVALAARLSEGGIPAVPAADLAAAVAMADIVSCATLAREPLIRGEWLRRGSHLDLVGGYTPEMREADDEAVRRARVFVDTRAGATTEAGDIVQPLASGALTLERIAGDLAALCRGEATGRHDAGEITLFKSVGAALEDLAAAQLAITRLGG
jgi:ornithine cyclodeaminase/alanine dehydrogenase-like protein (mu-crystallin family)